nr:hypothetical protein [Variovorax paradoxus]
MLHHLTYALCRLQIAALLDAVQTPDQLGRQYGLHGQRTEPREDVQFQVTHHLLGIAGGPSAILSRPGMPSADYSFKGIQASNAIAFFSLVSAIEDLPKY